METFSALLAICAGNSPVAGEFPAQRPVTRGVDVFFDLRLNKRLSKQSWGWWFETLSRPLWRHGNYIHTCNRLVASDKYLHPTWNHWMFLRMGILCSVSYLLVWYIRTSIVSKHNEDCSADYFFQHNAVEKARIKHPKRKKSSFAWFALKQQIFTITRVRMVCGFRHICLMLWIY